MYAVACNVRQYSTLYAKLAKHSLIFVSLYAVGIICLSSIGRYYHRCSLLCRWQPYHQLVQQFFDLTISSSSLLAVIRVYFCLTITVSGFHLFFSYFLRPLSTFIGVAPLSTMSSSFTPVNFPPSALKK